MRRICFMLLLVVALIIVPALAQSKIDDDASSTSASRWSPDCLHPATAEDSEACSARDEADEAKWTGYWTLGSMVMALVGTGIGGATLIAVWRGFQQARETQQQEFRAYLKVQNISMTAGEDKEGNGTFTVKATVENYGRTMARRISGSSSVVIFNGSGFSDDQFMDSIYPPDIHPSQGKPEYIRGMRPTVVTKAQYDAALRDKGVAEVVIRLDYEDIFRNRYVELQHTMIEYPNWAPQKTVISKNRHRRAPEKGNANLAVSRP